jgi:hypothetical protein
VIELNYSLIKSELLSDEKHSGDVIEAKVLSESIVLLLVISCIVAIT